MNPTINTISLYVVIPGMSFIVMFASPKIYFQNKYLWMYVVLIVWCLVTAIMAQDVDVALRHMIRMIAAYLFSVISFYLAQNKSYNRLLCIIVVIKFIVIILAGISENQFVIAEDNEDRHQFGSVNANMIGYFLFYATFAIFMIIRMFKFKYLLSHVIIIALIILSLYISLITASRQILIVQIPLIAGIYFITYYKNSMGNLFIMLCVIILSITVILPIFNSYYEYSLLATRNSENLNDDIRYVLINHAINEFMNYPIFGMGPNNFVLKYGLFTHNTYLELLVNSGFFAAIVYILMILRFIIKQYKRYKLTNDRTFLMYFVFAFIFAYANVFYVYISNMWLMGVFFIFVGLSENYLKNKYQLK